MPSVELPDEGELEPAPENERDSMRRALRDLEAAQARVKRDADRVYQETRAQLVSELLPVIDNLDRTLRVATKSGADRALLDGVRMTRAQLDQVLARYGAERIDATNQRFDPALHDAFMAVPVTDPRWNGVVIEQLEPGYKFGGRVLRPAKVSVGVLRR